MSYLNINEIDVVQSERETTVYDSMAAYSRAINQLMKTECTKSFISMLPVPRVFGNHVEMLRKVKEQQDAQIADAQAKQATEAQEKSTPSEAVDVDRSQQKRGPSAPPVHLTRM